MFWNIVLRIIEVLMIAFVLLGFIAILKRRDSVYAGNPEQKNPFEGKKVIFVHDDNDKENADGERGHLEVVGDSDFKQGFYGRVVKRVIDIILSFGGLVILSPVFLIIAIALEIDDPGPLFFTQKRVGRNKQYFVGNPLRLSY